MPWLFCGDGVLVIKFKKRVIIAVAKDDRISRIEVGYGLEGALPDAKTGQIQDEYMIPYFQANDYNKGILNGYLALAQVVAQEYQVTLETGPPQTLPAVPSTTYHLPGWAIFIIVILAGFLLYLDQRFLNGFLLGLILGMLFRGRGGGGGFGGGGFGGEAVLAAAAAAQDAGKYKNIKLTS